MKQSQSLLRVFEVEVEDKNKHYLVQFEKQETVYLCHVPGKVLDKLCLVVNNTGQTYESPFTAYRCVEINPAEIFNK